MLYKWSMATRPTLMKDPLSDAGMKSRWDNNQDWASSGIAFLASRLVMKTLAGLPRDYSVLNASL